MSTVASATAVDLAPAQNTHPVNSPLWWVLELDRELAMRWPLIAVYEDYFEGRHKLTFATSKYRESFGQMVAAVSDNWIPLIINAWVERLRPQGFGFGDADRKGDKDAWNMWQANHLDADIRLAFIESGKHGESYLLVWPESNPRGIFGRYFSRNGSDAPPRITIEHPSQFVVRREAGDRRRRIAALKKWKEGDGTVMATLYLPNEIHRFQRKPGGGWEGRSGVNASDKHKLGVVPGVPIVNDPQMLPCRPPNSLILAPHHIPTDAYIGLGRSDQADAISTVDQINKLLSDMLVASEFAAFKQRWATGLELPEGDEEEKFKAAIDRIWASGSTETEFGEFSAAELENWGKAMDGRIQSLGARTNTPPSYFPGAGLSNISDRALKTTEAGLAAKTNGRKTYGGESIEEAIRIGFAWKGDKRAEATDSEIFWAPSEVRSEAEHVDALTKKLALGVPKEQLWADAGYSPQQIASFKVMLLEEAKRIGTFDLDGPDVPPEPPELPEAGEE